MSSGAQRLRVRAYDQVDDVLRSLASLDATIDEFGVPELIRGAENMRAYSCYVAPSDPRFGKDA